jgi:hypothetical protein
MENNEDVTWRDVNKKVQTKIDREDLKKKIKARIKPLTFNQRQIWKALFEANLMEKIFGHKMPIIDEFWDNEITFINSLVPSDSLVICDNYCRDLNKENTFLFKNFFVDAFVFIATSALLNEL